MFEEAGMNIKKDPHNLIYMPHAGRHTITYHKLVLGKLTEATKGLTGSQYTKNLQNALDELRKDLIKDPRIPYK